VEDQQPAASGLTDKAPDVEAPTARGADAAAGTEVAETDAGRLELASSTDESVTGGDEGASAPTRSAPGDFDDTGVADVGDTATEGDEDKAPTGADDGSPTARRPVGKWLAIAAGAAAVLFVCSAAFAGATVQPYLADEATVATKLNIARTAANAVTTLWTYTPDNLDKLPDRAATYLSGDFEVQYRKFIDAIAPANKQAKITNNTQVVGAAVESLNGPEAVAIVYTNTTSTSPMTKGIPSLKYLSYRLFMKRAHAHWLVTRMTTITSLDLTPRV
jgi:Mce-associated membrane protein